MHENGTKFADKIIPCDIRILDTLEYHLERNHSCIKLLKPDYLFSLISKYHQTCESMSFLINISKEFTAFWRTSPISLSAPRFAYFKITLENLLSKFYFLSNLLNSSISYLCHLLNRSERETGWMG